CSTCPPRPCGPGRTAARRSPSGPMGRTSNAPSKLDCAETSTPRSAPACPRATRSSPAGGEPVGGTRVLVVDDELNICALLSATLRHVGYEVRVAHAGAEALTVAEEYQPELAVLDVLLPDFDGFQVAQKLRADGRTLPVLFLTARDPAPDRLSGLTTLGDDWLPKPFSLE